jgi:deoxyribodipyrimidine photolyase-related protein
MTKAANLIFPHQLFSKSVLLENGHDIYLIEEHLFFKQYRFHRQKIAFHRASMKYYQGYLQELGKTVYYIESNNEMSDIRELGNELRAKSITELHVIDPVDNWLSKRVQGLASVCEIRIYDSPQFLNTEKDLSSFFKPEKKSFFQTAFYKQQRKRLGILMDENQEPVGGQWTFDMDNRKKYPKGKVPPAIHFPDRSEFWNEAIDYTHRHFKSNPGSISQDRLYPITHQEADAWFEQFLTYRFNDFGAYEDAIVKERSFLHHSVLSPLINVGLLLPKKVVEVSLSYAEEAAIPINSTEGFIRQLIGWREFIRGMYLSKGSYSRTLNFWKFDRKIPPSFYDGTTGIDPIDQTIKKILDTGYCHHIERLMVLGNFMLLCEFDPDEVYRWFMELFIDAYDWVMVPNVYGMCLFADGGTFATKPYIGGSNYIKKMSNYAPGDWEKSWDGMFWQFVEKHQDFFVSNPRISMLAYSYKRMSAEKRTEHANNADLFTKRILNGV